jgi:endonuclease YncB( thermonuclease family)
MPLALLLCLVVGVTDGDTLTARCGTEPPQRLTIRIAEIDAAEGGQPFSARSKQHLASLCFGTDAEVRAKTTDRYGRTVARITYAGTDAKAAMVEAGMAWAFTKYVTDPRLPELQATAMTRRAGLWADPSPVSPWEWKGRKGEARH